MSYLKMYNDNLDEWVSSFVNCELTEHKIASEFKGKMLMLAIMKSAEKKKKKSCSIDVARKEW